MVVIEYAIPSLQCKIIHHDIADLVPQVRELLPIEVACPLDRVFALAKKLVKASGICNTALFFPFPSLHRKTRRLGYNLFIDFKRDSPHGHPSVFPGSHKLSG